MARKPTEKRAKRPPGRPASHGRDAAEEARRLAARFPNARVIKRYANRKLYDAHKSKQVTIDDIERFLRRGEDVRVIEADTGEEITQRILIQILLEERSAKVLELLPVELLRAMVALPSEPIARWLADYLAAGARWLQWQMGPMAGAGGFPGMPWANGATAPNPPPPAEAPERPRASGKAAKGARPSEDGSAGAHLRADLDELWRRLGNLRRP